MAKNKIGDLRDHLFIMLEELSDESLTEEQFERAIKKAKAISDIGKVIVDTAKEENTFMKMQERVGRSNSVFFNSSEKPQLPPKSALPE